MLSNPQRMYVAFVGMDWADQKHDYCQSDASDLVLHKGQIDSRPEAVAEFVNQLRQKARGGRVAICLEQTRGALIHQLMGAEFIDLYPINPQALANYRKAFAVSRAKDDPTDAYLLWEFLIKHFDHLRLWQPDDVMTRKLAFLVEDRRDLVDQRTRLSNKLTAALKGYFPQAIEWVGSTMTSPMACDFLLRWPSLSHLKRARPQTIQDFYTHHHVRAHKIIHARLDAIAKSVPLVEDAAIVDSAILKVKALCRQIASINQDLDAYDQQIADLLEAHPDTDLFKSFPAAGPALAPRLLTAMGTDRQRYSTSDDVATLTGIAPVTERSGKVVIVHWRLACSKFLRQTFHEFANCSRQKSDWANAYYHMQRARGKSHHAAIRALAFKWIRIIFRCWKNQELYDEQTYLRALQRTGSPILDFLPSAA